MLWTFKLKRFLKELEEKIEDKVEVYFHDDGDGIVSAVVFSKYLESIGVDYEIIPYTTVSDIKDTKVQKVFLDTTPYKDGNFIVIDHHVSEKKSFSLYLNFMDVFKKPGSTAFYLSFMLKDKIKIHPAFFVVAAMQDGAFGEVRDLLKKVLKENYEIFVPRDYPGMYIQLFSAAVNSILAKRTLWKKIFKVCNDLLENGLFVVEKKEFWELYDEFRKGARKAIKLIIGIKNYGRNLTIIKLKDTKDKLYRFAIAYAMSTFEGEVKVFLKEGKDRVKFSIRSYRTNLHKIMREIGEKIEVQWGGHERAIGGWIKKEKVEEFIEAIKSLV